MILDTARGSRGRLNNNEQLQEIDAVDQYHCLCYNTVLLQESARVPPLSQHLNPAGLPLRSSANLLHQRGSRPRALPLPQASGGEAGQPDQPDGCQGPEQQSVQRALHLPVPPVSWHPLSAPPGQDVSTAVPQPTPALISHILQIFHAKNYSILWCGFHQWGPS